MMNWSTKFHHQFVSPNFPSLRLQHKVSSFYSNFNFSFHILHLLCHYPQSHNPQSPFTFSNPPFPSHYPR